MPDFLKPGDDEKLKDLLATTKSAADRKRARILLDIEAGLSAREISAKTDAPVHRVLHWRREYLKRGLGLFLEKLIEP